MYLFEDGCEERQKKMLVGKNIDIKVDFDSNIMAVTTDQSIVAVIFGSQSLLLEFDESQYPKFINEANEAIVIYKKSINNLNDLVFIFKQILLLQYNGQGYIRITED
jgi:hypothetical protein